MRRVDRFGHAGKSRYEKGAYKNFLASKFHLDQTESELVDIGKTNESSFEEEKIESIKIQKKSKWLKIKDFFYDNLVVTTLGGVVSGIILVVMIGYISINREQGIQSEKISTIEKDIEELNKDNKEDVNNFNLFKESFNVFKIEVSKDLEFIKKKLKF